MDRLRGNCRRACLFDSVLVGGAAGARFTGLNDQVHSTVKLTNNKHYMMSFITIPAVTLRCVQGVFGGALNMN
jgi:hypothetical protein